MQDNCSKLSVWYPNGNHCKPLKRRGDFGQHIVRNGDNKGATVRLLGSGPRLDRLPAMQYLGVSQNRGTFLGVPIIRSIIFWGLYWGTPILGNNHLDNED